MAHFQYRSMSSWLPFAALLLITLFVRLPFFFPAVIDWDESTFILIGQSILDGHLPYTHLWDVKPPLLFAFFAAAIALFGKTVVGIRIAGTLCVAMTAWLVFVIARRWCSATAAFAGAIAAILLTSLLDGSSATMSEHMMLPAFMAAVYLSICRPPSASASFGIGVLLAITTLVRSSMIFTPVAAALSIAFRGARPRREVVRFLAAYVSGGLLVLALVCLPFAFAGELPLLWKSAMVAALVRADLQSASGSRLVDLGARAVEAAGDDWSGGVLWVALLVWLGSVAGLAAMWARARAASGHVSDTFVSLLMFSVATLGGIVISGSAYSHYFIQLAPLAAICFAALLHYPPTAVRRAAGAIFLVLAVDSLRPVVAEYRILLSRAAAGEELRHGPAYEIAAYLQRENSTRRPMLILTAHVVHWLTDSEPPTRFVTHPSMLSRDHVLAVMGTTGLAELIKIFQADPPPEFVVIDPTRDVLGEDSRAWLESVLNRDYAVVMEIDGVAIYRKMPGRPV